MKTVLVARMDNDGDVLLAGPAVRALATTDRVVLLVSPTGEQAARQLPGVHDVLVWPCPWTGFDPPKVDRRSVNTLIDALALEHLGAGFVLTSFHQGPLPMAFVLRLAGLRYIAANCEDYPGSLLDLRNHPPPSHEVDRGLDLVRAAGYDLPAGDDGALRVKRLLPAPDAKYVVVHPGASVPARTASPRWFRALVAALTAEGHQVWVTGTATERELTRFVAGSNGVDLGGKTRYPELAAILDGADCVVVGNTGPAHLAAAVATPVVSLFAPVVPLDRWAPWKVPCVVLGDQQAACRDSRARQCPVPGHPCLDAVPIEEAVAAVHKLVEEVA
ncbi:glycosyltransferase family 9 protein [Kribbella jejuensis]|uniref:ADP-heptose:LPS heptosyltransferase n=1 Tax=Kribbella jejuensis TaxID=236068 RepID=A0A542EA61_9ACTN|nr:glycosyltransferase family 9 protein [Kribbella jejuensis]TQJ12189.1 ADP-heptose:LPS heptosyltransferase [Kribbella jejuensis]